jgi:hypothetical protein
MPNWLIPIMALLCASLACLGGGGQPALVFSPDQLPSAALGQPYSAIIIITQNVTPVGQMSVARAELPPGLTFIFQKGQSAGEIKGVPSQAGTFKFTVSAWCFGTNISGQSGHHDYQLVVQ